MTRRRQHGANPPHGTRILARRQNHHHLIPRFEVRIPDADIGARKIAAQQGAFAVPRNVIVEILGRKQTLRLEESAGCVRRPVRLRVCGEFTRAAIGLQPERFFRPGFFVCHQGPPGKFRPQRSHVFVARIVAGIQDGVAKRIRTGDITLQTLEFHSARRIHKTRTDRDEVANIQWNPRNLPIFAEIHHDTAIGDPLFKHRGRCPIEPGENRCQAPAFYRFAGCNLALLAVECGGHRFRSDRNHARGMEQGLSFPWKKQYIFVFDSAGRVGCAPGTRTIAVFACTGTQFLEPR